MEELELEVKKTLMKLDRSSLAFATDIPPVQMPSMNPNKKPYDLVDPVIEIYLGLVKTIG